MSDWKQDFSSKCNSWTRSAATDSPSPLNTSPDSPKNTVSFPASLFSLSSVSLSCFLSSSLSSPPSCRSASFNPLPSVSFLSEFLSSKQPRSRQNRWVWNVPALHTTMDDSGPQWDCVCVFFLPLHESIFFFLSSAIHFFFSLCQHPCTQNLLVSTVAPCLSVSIFPLFRDIQSSASKLGYSMPLPNCPTASGSDRSSYAEQGLTPTLKPWRCHLCGQTFFSRSTCVYMQIICVEEHIKGCMQVCLITEGQVYSFLPPAPLWHTAMGAPACLHPTSIYRYPSFLFVSASFSHPYFSCTSLLRTSCLLFSPRFPFHSSNFCLPFPLSFFALLEAWLASIVGQLWGCNQTSSC